MKNYITHNSRFHADEEMGYAIVRGVYPAINAIRTDGKTAIEIQKDGDIVADTGREYDPKKLRFDHHQDYITRPNGVPYSACGLLWKHFGTEYVRRMIVRGKIDLELGLADLVVDRVDETLIQGICANDAGKSYQIKVNESGVEVRPTTIYHIVAMMNSSDPNDHEAQELRFNAANEICIEVLKASVKSAATFVKGKIEFKNICRDQGEILHLSKFVPWNEIVHTDYPNARAVITPGTQSKYSLTLVPNDPANRSAGFRTGKGLEKKGDFNEFVHNSGFIAGSESKGALMRLFYDNFETHNN